MKIETAKKAIALLQGFFNRKLSDDAVAFYVNHFRAVDDAVFVAAVNEACRAEKTLPTPRMLREYVITLQRRKQEFEQPTKSAQIFAIKPGDSECVKESRGILRRMWEKNLWGEDLVDEMLHMEQSFPGRGWGREGRELQEQIKKLHGGAADK